MFKFKRKQKKEMQCIRKKNNRKLTNIRFVLTTFTNSVRIRNLNMKRGVHTFL